MDGIDELYHLFQLCYPGVILSEGYARKLMAREDRVLFERHRDGKLIAALILYENTVLLFCVAPQYRCQGIGSELLQEAEIFLRSNGVEEIKLCEGGDYLTPGAPMYPGNRVFFEKRGYVHEGGENRSVDMMVDLSLFEYTEHRIGDSIDGITYRFAEPEDREGAVNCAGDALKEFAEFYWDEKLYDPENGERVLIAVRQPQEGDPFDPAENVCGALLVNLAGEMPGIGSIGCTSVRPSCAGHGIATNMVRLATGALKEAGLEKGFLSYTYADIVHMYARSGYEISMRYFMGKKKLVEGGNVMKAKKQMEREVVIQYRELEGNLDQIEERIYEQFRQKGNDVEEIEKLQIYVKPQDFTAYYVINDSYYGKVAIF